MVFGVARHHVVHDGRIGFHFLRTWLSLAQGYTAADQHPPPFLDRTILRAQSPPHVQFDHPEYFHKNSDPISKPYPSKTPDATTSTSCAMKLSQDQINILKCSGKPDSIVAKSTFSMVAVHVWKCVCAARGLSPETTARLVFVVDFRNRLHPPLSQLYFGNAFIRTSVVATVHDVLFESVAGMVQKIKGAIDCVDDSYIRSAIDSMEPSGPSTNMTAWSWEPSGRFSTSSAYKVLHNRGITCPFSNRLWKIKAPPKVRVFIWVMLPNKLLTREVLYKRGCGMILGCTLCLANLGRCSTFAVGMSLRTGTLGSALHYALTTPHPISHVGSYSPMESSTVAATA